MAALTDYSALAYVALKPKNSSLLGDYVASLCKAFKTAPVKEPLLTKALAHALPLMSL